MKIKNVDIQNFMLFQELNVDLSRDVNVIFGENSTGKTALMKLLYTQAAVLSKLGRELHADQTKAAVEGAFAKKLINVFKPSNNALLRLVTRTGATRASIHTVFDNDADVRLSFSNKQINHLDYQLDRGVETEFTPVYIPPKEIISTAGTFCSLYERYEIGFDETYYDLAKLLLWPLQKGRDSEEKNSVLTLFSDIMKGNISQDNDQFFLKIQGDGNFEMNLVSEGYRKLATLMYLVMSGGLANNSILFWDEPEANMNPKMIYPVAKALINLSKLGVQVFVTTHSYFVQQAFNMAAVYQDHEADEHPMDIRFISLFRNEDGRVGVQTADRLSDIQYDPIMEEFDEVYDREQRLINGDRADEYRVKECIRINNLIYQ